MTIGNLVRMIEQHLQVLEKNMKHCADDNNVVVANGVAQAYHIGCKRGEEKAYRKLLPLLRELEKEYEDEGYLDEFDGGFRLP